MCARHWLIRCICDPQPQPTDIYTLSLHDALPIYAQHSQELRADVENSRLCLAKNSEQHARRDEEEDADECRDRKSTRLNSSHVEISYAVFCLKKKKKSLNESTKLMLFHCRPPATA